VSIGFFGAERAVRARNVGLRRSERQWAVTHPSATGVGKAEGAALRFAGWEHWYPVKRPFAEIFRRMGWAGKGAGADRSGLDLRDALVNSAQTGADLLGGLRA
jgi:hypothetical protein